MVFPPMVSPRFRVEGLVLQYKPYPSYATWLVAWDMTELISFMLDFTSESMTTEMERALAAEALLQEQIDAVVITADLAYISGATAEEQAGIARAEAAEAYGFAEVANIAVEDLQIEVNDLEDRVTALETP